MVSHSEVQSGGVKPAAHESEQAEGEHQVPPPVGTSFVLIAYLAILAGMWGSMYLGVLTR